MTGGRRLDVPAPGGSSAGRPQLVAVVGEDCTGCQTCVEICLVDCIEPARPASGPLPPAPVHVREDECIGCFLCAKVCEELEVNAIHLVPAAGRGADTGNGRSTV